MPSYSHLSRNERSEIAILAAVDHSIGAIARSLGRAKFTIGRELKRNRLPKGAIRRVTQTELSVAQTA